MNIGLLSVRITVQKSTTQTDSIGNHMNAWQEYYSCAATLSGETGQEADDAGITVDNTKADFTVRYCELTSALTPLRYRVIYNGERYDILSVDHLNNKRKAVKLRCQKARR